MATNISISIDAYQHLDNTYDPTNLGKVEVTVEEKQNWSYLVFKLPSHEDNFAITLDDLKRAIRALEDL
jgi:hypothetical protein